MSFGPVRRHLVDTPAGQVHVRTTGDLDGGTTPLVLLHQTPSSGREWAAVAAALDPHPCIVPDMIGLGFSDAPPKAMSVTDHAEALAAAAGAFADEWVLAGHHTGAVMAAVLAGAVEPARTRGLGIIGYPLYATWQERYARLINCVALDIDDDGAAAARLWREIGAGFEPGTPFETRLQAMADKLLAGPVWYGTYVALWMSDLPQILSAARALDRPTTVLGPIDDGLTRFAEASAALLGVEVTPTAGGGRVLSEHPEMVAGHLRALVAAAGAATVPGDVSSPA